MCLPITLSLRLRILLCLLLVCGVWLPSGAQTPGPEGLVPDSTELRVLRQFYNTTSGPTWNNRTNWLTGTTVAEAGTWFGVTVANGDVTGLVSNGNNLQGTIPASLGMLAQLNLPYSRCLMCFASDGLGQLQQPQHLYKAPAEFWTLSQPNWSMCKLASQTILTATIMSGASPAAAA
jgi:hypothetical protein